jgi:hypothetical protein
MITKINDCKIEHQPNTKMVFLDWNNLIESVTKPIMKLNSQLTQCIWMKLKELIKKEKKVNLIRSAN